MPNGRKPTVMTPEQARRRLRRAAVHTERDMRIIAENRKPLEEWDTEELAMGRPRGKNGAFIGPSPKWITPVLMQEAKRRLQMKTISGLTGKIEDAIAVLYKLMMSDARDENGRFIVDPKTRLDAAKFIIEMTIGKAKQRVELEDGRGWQHMLAGAMRVEDTDGDYVDAHPIVDLTEAEWEDADDQ